jgi:uncharacterized Zn finger protein
MRSQRMTEREKAESRLRAALVNGGAKAAQPRGDSRYTVYGRTENRYTVFAPSMERMICDCPAGTFDKDCWHKAAVYLRLVADSTVQEVA